LLDHFQDFKMSLDVSLTEDVYDSRGRFRDTIEVFDYNITHNLTHMAKAAGVYGIP